MTGSSFFFKSSPYREKIISLRLQRQGGARVVTVEFFPRDRAVPTLAVPNTVMGLNLTVIKCHKIKIFIKTSD